MGVGGGSRGYEPEGMDKTVDGKSRSCVNIEGPWDGRRRRRREPDQKRPRERVDTHGPGVVCLVREPIGSRGPQASYSGEAVMTRDSVLADPN